MTRKVDLNSISQEVTHLCSVWLCSQDTGKCLQLDTQPGNEETPVTNPLPQPQLSEQVDSVKAKPITTAMNAIFLKFISRITAANKRAIGVNTGLNAGILSFTLVHICTKPKHITISVSEKKNPQTKKHELAAKFIIIKKGPRFPSTKDFPSSGSISLCETVLSIYRLHLSLQAHL